MDVLEKIWKFVTQSNISLCVLSFCFFLLWVFFLCVCKSSFFLLFKKDFIYLLFKERGTEGERGGKHQHGVASHVPPLLGTWPATQAGALTGNVTSDPFWFAGQHSVHWATPARAFFYFNIKKYQNPFLTYSPPLNRRSSHLLSLYVREMQRPMYSQSP